MADVNPFHDDAIGDSVHLKPVLNSNHRDYFNITPAEKGDPMGTNEYRFGDNDRRDVKCE